MSRDLRGVSGAACPAVIVAVAGVTLEAGTRAEKARQPGADQPQRHESPTTPATGTTTRPPRKTGTSLQITMTPDWQGRLDASIDEVYSDKLGPAIREDAYRYCPKRTGGLADSIEYHLDGHTLIISATGSDDRDYASYVETGHRIVAGSPRAVTNRKTLSEPFLRPALYTKRTF
jgi:hypothetical protein